MALESTWSSTAPAPSDYTLDELCDTMARRHLQSLRIDGIELVMDPSGWRSDPEAISPDELAEQLAENCPCGHALMTDHNEHGCLHGCAIDVCAPKQKE
jgi:phosphoribosylformimino-5-aminoimidazole carboxamide ribonucleotide (ProFAR) isomerase